MHMTRTNLLGLIALVVAAGMVVFSISGAARRTAHETPVHSQPPAAASTSGDASPSKPANPFVQSCHYTTPEKLPAGWEDFRSINQMEQLNRVTVAMENHKLAPDILAFLEAEIFNRGYLGTVTDYS
jgi:hypothetical protein